MSRHLPVICACSLNVEDMSRHLPVICAGTRRASKCRTAPASYVQLLTGTSASVGYDTNGRTGVGGPGRCGRCVIHSDINQILVILIGVRSARRNFGSQHHLYLYNIANASGPQPGTPCRSYWQQGGRLTQLRRTIGRRAKQAGQLRIAWGVSLPRARTRNQQRPKRRRQQPA
jgi:hypothetical protein